MGRTDMDGGQFVSRNIPGYQRLGDRAPDGPEPDQTDSGLCRPHALAAPECCSREMET